MEISTHKRQQFLASVANNTPLCRDHFRLTFRVPTFPPTQPGQFIQIACEDPDIGQEELCEFDWKPGLEFQGKELLEPRAILRRPFSLAGRRDVDGQVELEIIHRVVGLATHWLAELQPNEEVSILGPLGNVFELPVSGSTALLVGGGVGIPPMIYLASASAGHKAVAFAGATTRELLPLTVTDDPKMSIAEFALHGIPTVISTDDGSLGQRGFVTQALESYLDSHPKQKFTIYTCGPEAMMKRVAAIALQRDIPCQVAVERAIACGMGTCQSCCIRVKKPDPSAVPLPGSDWCYRLACTDGPIFPADQLLW